MALRKPQATSQDGRAEAETFVSLVSYPARDTAPERMLRWKIREENQPKSSSVAACFHLFDNERRIEILKSGVYRVQLYLEPVDSDVSRYHLEVNGSSVASRANSNLLRCYVSKCVHESSDARGGLLDAAGTQAATARAHAMEDRKDAALKVLNVFELRLNKWDMVLVRRKSNWIGKYGGRTAFGRLLIEALG